MDSASQFEDTKEVFRPFVPPQLEDADELELFSLQNF
jgi:hypothetical protein